MAKLSPVVVGGGLAVVALAYIVARGKPAGAVSLSSGPGSAGTGADPAATAAIAGVYGSAIDALGSAYAAQANAASSIAIANAQRDASIRASDAQVQIAGKQAGAAKVASVTNPGFIGSVVGVAKGIGKLFGL